MGGHRKGRLARQFHARNTQTPRRKVRAHVHKVGTRAHPKTHNARVVARRGCGWVPIPRLGSVPRVGGHTYTAGFAMRRSVTGLFMRCTVL